jgi:hypothetical protein
VALAAGAADLWRKNFKAAGALTAARMQPVQAATFLPRKCRGFGQQGSVAAGMLKIKVLNCVGQTFVGENETNITRISHTMLHDSS